MRNLEDGEFDDSGPLPRVPIITRGQSSDSSYACLKETHREHAEDPLPRVDNAVFWWGPLL